jgi:integrase
MQTAQPRNPDTTNRIKLANTAIEKITPPSQGAQLYWFESVGVRGLGLRVTASGVKSFILQRRIKGQEKRKTIGRYPELSATAAREKAEKLNGLIAKGDDPIALAKRAKLEATTLEQAFEAYFKHKQLKPGTVTDMRRALTETFSDWQGISICKITRSKVERLYRERVARSTARTNLAFRYLRSVFNLAMVRYRDSEEKAILVDNPVSILSEGKLWHKVSRRRTVLTPEDLKVWVPAVMRLGETPERERGMGKLMPTLRHGRVYRDLLLFYALTGCRRSEALNLTKDDVDLKKGFVTFRDTKNHTDHRLPLTPYLTHLLKLRISETPTGSEWVFASPHDGAQLSNPRTVLGRIAKETGLKFTFHDLRRLAATSLERSGVPAYTIKAILNHATESRDVTGGYIVVDDHMKLEALETLGSFVLSHGEKKCDVVMFERRRAG